MEAPKITPTERLILVNQYRILASVEEYGEEYNTLAEIVERGYKGLYYKLFDSLHDEVSEEVTEETNDILDMFRHIQSGIASLTDDEKKQLNMSTLSFGGFDANHDDHYFQMEFMVKKLGLWDELKNTYLNSHSQAYLPRYRAQLAVFNSVRKLESPLGLADLQQIANAK